MSYRLPKLPEIRVSRLRGAHKRAEPQPWVTSVTRNPGAPWGPPSDFGEVARYSPIDASAGRDLRYNSPVRKPGRLEALGIQRQLVGNLAGAIQSVNRGMPVSKPEEAVRSKAAGRPLLPGLG
jgi:hypothetical protein